MKKKNGFTLIELLSILVILSMVALITIPVIIDSIDSAEKDTFEDRIYGMVRAAELDYTKGEFTEDVIYQVGTGKLTRSVPSLTEVDVKGKIEGTGSIIIAEDGNVIVSVYDGTWCATKTSGQSKVSLKEGSCPPLLLETYQIGEQVRVKGLTGTFHVIKPAGLSENMVLILADTAHAIGAFSTGSNEFRGSLAEQELNEYTETWKINIESVGGNTSGLVISIPSREELQTIRVFYGFQGDSDTDSIDWLKMDGEYPMYTKTPATSGHIYAYQFNRIYVFPTYNAPTKYLGHIRPTLLIDKSNLTKVS